MSYSKTFHCVYFELSTVKGKPLELRVKVLFRLFPVSDLISEKKIAKNRQKSPKIAKNRLDRLRFSPNVINGNG